MSQREQRKGDRKDEPDAAPAYAQCTSQVSLPSQRRQRFPADLEVFIIERRSNVALNKVAVLGKESIYFKEE
jgi:hypothetical protein